MDGDTLRQFFIWLVPSVPAIVVHEVAHGWTASRLGDPTARNAGRLSLNPIRHFDLIGTFIVPCLMILAHLHFVFGWAKPVPVNFQRLKNIRVDTILVALAGPLSNLLMMSGWLVLLSSIAAGGAYKTDDMVLLLAQMAVSGAVVNVALIIFNLIPIPPLDGGRALGALLPQVLSKPFMKLERYGIIIILLLIGSGVFNKIFLPVVEFFLGHFGIR